MRRIMTALAVPAAVLALPLVTACTGSPEHGTVTAKDYRPGSVTQRPDYRNQCTGSGSHRTCHLVITGYHPVHHPACWQLSLRNDQGKTGTVCVTRAEYNAIKIGAKR